MRTLLFLLLFSTTALAQSERSGITIGAQAGFEYINYVENFVNTSREPAVLEGSSTAIVGTLSLEYDLEPRFEIPMFFAVSGGMPFTTSTGRERGTFVRLGQTFLNQEQDVEHEYHMFRAFVGYKAKSVFTPFLIFERSLFQSTRSNMLIGTDSGVLVPADTGITWKERVWSSHIGAGFQGGIPLEPSNQWSVRYRAAVMFPMSVFVTNDHPNLQEQGQTLGSNAGGITALSRITVHYNWHERSSLQLGVNWYFRKWDGDGNLSEAGSFWPANEMNAVPVLLGLTWSI